MIESFPDQNIIVLHPEQAGLDEVMEEVQRMIVTKKLEDTGGNIAEAARDLRISRPRLYDLMSRYGLARSRAIVRSRR